MSNSILKITDGTTSVDFLHSNAYYLSEWRPTVAQYKGGGVYRDSALTDGRGLVFKRYENPIETFELHIKSHNNQDEAISFTRRLRNLLEKAADYWTSPFQSQPVWLEARSSKETNIRYALIHSGQLPEDGNPYSAPWLQPDCSAVNAELTCVIERGHWLETRPGVETAVEISARETYARPISYSLIFNGLNSYVNCGSDAGFDNLQAGVNGFTVESWIKPDSLGTPHRSLLFFKALWTLAFYPDEGKLRAFVHTFGGVPAQTDINWTVDENWHHLAMTYKNSTDRKVHFFVDGVEATYTTQQAATGTLWGDSAYLFLFGGTNAGGWSPFDGQMSQIRVSNTVRYTASFTPPARCTLLSSDASTVALYNLTEGSGTTIDNAEGTAARDGTLSNVGWSPSCVVEAVYGNVDADDVRDPTTNEGEVFIVNKRVEANITHVYNNSGATWSGNLVDTMPYNIFPDSNPTVNEAVYFGIDSTVTDSGQFSNLVFNLEITGAVGDYTGLWQYYNGVSFVTSLAEDDKTAAVVGTPFSLPGIGTVSWRHKTDWVPGNLQTIFGGTAPSVTAYWVRVIINGNTTNPSIPKQVVRNIYSVVWPYTEVQLDQVPGDIPVLSRIRIYPHTLEGSGGGSFHRFISGLRSISRGDEFVPVVNLGHRQNANGVTVENLGAFASFVSDLEMPVGRRINANQTAGLSYQRVFDIAFDKTISNHYYGKYRAIIRGHQPVHPADVDILHHLQVIVDTSGQNAVIWETAAATFQNTGKWALLDFGELVIPDFSVLQTEVYEKLIIRLEALNAMGVTATSTGYYDLWLLPTDEWFGDFTLKWASALGRNMDIDSILNPRTKIRCHLRTSDTLVAPAKVISAGESILQASSRQRLSFLSISSGGVPGDEFSHPELVSWLSISRQARYKSARGAR